MVDHKRDELDAQVEAALASCDGDPRATIRALLVLQAYLEAEIARLAEAVSTGFACGRVRTPAPARDAS